MDMGFDHTLWKHSRKVWVEGLDAMHSAFGENIARGCPYSIWELESVKERSFCLNKLRLLG